MISRFHLLDVLRFLAAFLVVTYHYYYFAANAIVLYTADTQYKSYIDSLSTYGYLGVQIFFVISGFIILHTAINKTSLEFIKSRIIRLWPAIFIGSTIAYAIFIILGPRAQLPIIDIWNYIANALGLTITPLRPLMSSSIIMNQLGKINMEYFDGAMWTLSREVGFYIFISIILIFRQIKNIHYLALLWVTFSYYTFLNYISPNASISGISLYTQLDYASYFALGIFSYLYFIKSDFLAQYKIINNKIIINIGLWLSLALSLYSVYDLAYVYNINHLNIAIPSIATLIYFALYLMFVFAINYNRNYSARTLSIFAILGGSSYTLYLMHQFNAYRIIDYYNHHFAWGYIHSTVLLIIIIPIIISIHLYLEKPLSNLVKRLLG